MANVPLWPINVLPPREFAINLAPRTLAGPSSISGVGQVATSDAGIWKATYGGVPVVSRQKILTWRSLGEWAEGRLNPFLIPITNFYQPYAPEWEAAYKTVPHSDQSPFSDHGEYRSRVINVALVSNIPLRGTTANLAIIAAHDIQPGQHFSIGDRLYRIRTLQMTGENTATITFRPPAREAVAAGTELEFDQPVCRMRLASDSEMDLPLDYGRWSFPSVNFIEDV